MAIIIVFFAFDTRRTSSKEYFLNCRPLAGSDVVIFDFGNNVEILLIGVLRLWRKLVNDCWQSGILSKVKRVSSDAAVMSVATMSAPFPEPRAEWMANCPIAAVDSTGHSAAPIRRASPLSTLPIAKPTDQSPIWQEASRDFAGRWLRRLWQAALYARQLASQLQPNLQHQFRSFNRQHILPFMNPAQNPKTADLRSNPCIIPILVINFIIKHFK
jgi:hypothetical protein